MTSNAVPIQLLRSEQEEADTLMLLHGLDAANRRNVHIHSKPRYRCTRSDALDLQETLYGYYIACRDRRKRKKYSSKITLRGGRRRPREGFTWLSPFSGCDQTGTISGKSKVCFSNNLKKAKQPMLDAFSSLGNSDTIPDDMYIKLKRFVCQLYIPSTQLREP